MHDVCVLQVEMTCAPYHIKSQVRLVTRAIWQVESEMANRAPEVAEDLGKLVAGGADNKLLVTCIPERRKLEPWIQFVQRAAAHVPGNFFLTMIPSFSTAGRGYAQWRKGTNVLITLYRHREGQLEQVGNPIGDC